MTSPGIPGIPEAADTQVSTPTTVDKSTSRSTYSPAVDTNNITLQDELSIIKHHVQFDRRLSASTEIEDWRSIPELPTSDELNPDDDRFQKLIEGRHLLPNPWKQPWKSKDTYLQTHYLLQREEGTTLLRLSIRKYKEDPTMMDDTETCVYTKVS